MTMDLSALGGIAGSFVRAELPNIATLLGGLVPPPFSLIAGPLFREVAEKLSVDPAAPDAPAQVQAAVDADPQAAADKLQVIEQAHKDLADAANEELRLRLADVQDARGTVVKLASAGSPLAMGSAFVSAVITAGFVGMLVLLAFRAVPDSSLMNIMMGTLAAAFGAVVNFYLGSSAGSQLKDLHLADLARSPTVTAQPGSHVEAGKITGRR